MTFTANKYDENNDPHMPKVGDFLGEDEESGRIAKVEPIVASKLLNLFQDNVTPDLEGHKELIVIDNPIRPFLKYLVWID